MGFTLHAGLGVIFCMAPLLYFIKYQTMPLLKRDPNIKLKNEIALWKSTASKVQSGVDSELNVKTQLESYI